MSEAGKKQTFLHGAALLALATAAVKLIGAFYKIPLKMIVGDQGFGYFSSAYDIYSLLLIISTAGLPVAMSRMISQASTLGNYRQVRRVYKTSQAIFLGLGLFSTIIMLVFADQFAAFLQQENAAIAIRCLAPSAFFMGVISTFRGFFQGQGNMRPTSVSQVLEAFFKLTVGLGLAWFFMRTYAHVPLAAGGAILGVTVSCLLSAIFLYCKFAPAYRVLPQTEDTPLSYGSTAKGLLAIAVPITIGSAGLQLLTVLETSLYMRQLLTSCAMSQETADITKGIYNMTHTIFNMPCAFLIPITVSVIPAITSQLTLENHGSVRATEESAARITGLLSLPCSVGLMLVARPVMALLGGYSGELLDLASKLMAVMAVSIFLYGIIQLTNAILQAHGYAHVPVVNTLLSGVAKLAVVYFLSGNPNIGILGVPIGFALCYGAISVMNLWSISRLVPQKPMLVKNLFRSALPALLMGVVVFLCDFVLQRIGVTSRLLLCGVPIAAGVVVYFLCVVLCKSITREDCLLLPKGDKIARLLKL